jgi:hypothetical protein
MKRILAVILFIQSFRILMFNILVDVVMSGSRRLIEISNFNNDIYLKVTI